MNAAHEDPSHEFIYSICPVAAFMNLQDRCMENSFFILTIVNDICIIPGVETKAFRFARHAFLVYYARYLVHECKAMTLSSGLLCIFD
jgi:hypothetical protein